MKRLIVPIICIPLLILSACKEEPSNDQARAETVKIDQDSELNIVPLYVSYQKYLNASLEAFDSECSKKNYAKYVLHEIDRVGKQEQFDPTSLKEYFMLQSTAYPEALLDRIDALFKRQDDIKKIITKNYTIAHDVLPKKKSTIFIAPLNSEYIRMTESMGGVAAAAYKDTFILYLDSDFDENVLAYTIAHEYHHLILQDRPEYQMNNVLDSAIVEGKADAFAERILKGMKPPWAIPMDTSTKKHVAQLIHSGEASYEDMIDGNTEKKLPRWSNYNLGRDIIDHYISSHPNASIKEWSFATEDDLLEGYTYQKLLQQ
ncbi:hypothetical protein ADM98_09625 [Exiguobacterium sp. BMC-KP]|uniref:DUF2268 domain-containing protein n=1 Tax=Exiguobacterium sp. BMC-KP TaxID=1684312 RepID=UPI0006AA35CF|nr:DUF2268 domain-containing putative Zn-dependent protease [Exiguobacterium sp. BMC-KP]KOP29154.1 hypothetical protein ADM98_09625 [Exiguobacterium sp. BMC-KP]